MLVGFYWQEIKAKYNNLKLQQKLWIKRGVASVALLTFTLSYASVFVLSLLFHLWGANYLPHWLQHVAYDWGNWNHDVWLYADKWKMGWLRIILFFFWFATLYWIFRRYERQIALRSKGILELLGKNSLFVYTCHAFIIFTLKMYFIPSRTNFLQNFLVTGVGLTALVLATMAYKRLQNRYDLNGSKLKMSLKSVFSS